jgi:hypothetical protein
MWLIPTLLLLLLCTLQLAACAEDFYKVCSPECLL